MNCSPLEAAQLKSAKIEDTSPEEQIEILTMISDAQREKINQLLKSIEVLTEERNMNKEGYPAMTDREIKVIELTIDEVNQLIRDITSQKTELEQRIQELENVKASLARLLPTDKQIHNLFR
jgi:tRNA U34 5-carboxymethylaminomethyl modifying GTPase MnmE/TrmE